MYPRRMLLDRAWNEVNETMCHMFAKTFGMRKQTWKTLNLEERIFEELH